MPQHTYAGPSRCTTMNNEQVHSLCNLLTLPPNLSPTSSFFHTSQHSKLTSLTKPLPQAILQPAGIIAEIKKTLHLSLPVPTHPCSTHGGLNQEVIYSIFKALEAEVIEHTKPLSHFMVKHEIIPSTVTKWLDRVNAINSLWCTPNEVHRFFPSTKTLSFLPYVESECEACTLAVVGGRPDVLFDLRASLVSRKSAKDKKVPRLLRFVDAWLEEGEHVDIMKDTSSALGDEIKYLRKEQKREHREREKLRAERKRVKNTQREGKGRESGVERGRMRSSTRTPSSIDALYAVETGPYTNSTTSRREREDFSLSNNSLSGPTSPVTSHPLNNSNNNPSQPLYPIHSQQEPKSPVSPMSMGFNDCYSDYGSMRGGDGSVSPLSAEFANVHSRSEGYMKWTAEDEAKRINDLMEKYKA